jgi:hypothetical protein
LLCSINSSVALGLRFISPGAWRVLFIVETLTSVAGREILFTLTPFPESTTCATGQEFPDMIKFMQSFIAIMAKECICGTSNWSACTAHQLLLIFIIYATALSSLAILRASGNQLSQCRSSYGIHVLLHHADISIWLA